MKKNSGTSMQIQIVTDNNIAGGEELATHVRNVVHRALDRFGRHVTRVKVHLSDENASKVGPGDKRCVMEVRLEGRKPSAAVQTAASVEQAVAGAANKSQKSIASTLERLRRQR